MIRRTVIMLLGCSALTVNAQLASTRNFEEAAGLTDKFIFAIAQDTNGVLLLGTESGVTAFNGDHFSVYGNRNQSPENQVSALYCDSRGIIWIGHFQKGVSAHRNGTIGVVDSSAAVQGRIQCFHEDSSRRLWGISQGKGIFFVNRISGQIVSCAGTENSANAITTLEDLLITGSGNGAIVYEGNSTAALQFVSVLPETKGYSIASVHTTQLHGKNMLFVAAEGAGIFCYDYVEGGFHFNSFIGEELALRDKSFSALATDQNGLLWIATMGEGIRKMSFNESGLPVSMEPHHFKDDNIRSLFVDTENNLWLGTFGSGLIELPHSAFHFYNQSNGLLRQEVNCVTKDKYGTLWIGTDSGVTRFCGNAVSCQGKTDCSRHYGAAEGFADEEVTCMVTDSAGMIWMGTRHLGLFLLDPCNETFLPVSAKRNLDALSINALTLTKDGRVVIGTTEGAYVYAYDTDRFTFLTTMEGLLHNDVQHLYTDHTNSVWFSSEGTPPYVMNNSGFYILREIDQLRGYMISSVCEDAAGTRWIATQGDGVFSFNGSHSHQYNSAYGLKSDHCISAVTDREGVLWVVHKSGLSMKFPDDSTFLSYSSVDNHMLQEFNPQVYTADDGSIYFCSDNGLIEIPPVNRESLRRYPRVSLNRIYINGNEVGNTSHLSLEAGSYNLTFEFNSILLSSAGFNPFYYRILGTDSSWTKSEGRSINIPQLTSGDYLLQVSGEPPGKMKSAPLNLTISIDLPVWRQPWFVASMLCLGPVLLLIGIRLRTLQLTKNNERLSLLVQQKTALLQMEKESVARMNAELKQKTKDITDSIQYAMRIQEAILPEVSIFKEEFPESFLYYRPRDIVSGDFYWFAKKGDLFFIAIADCTGHGVPGAFMSMIGCTLINKVVFDYRVDLPSGILDILNREIKMALHQQDAAGSSHDGMDIALCVIDKRKQVLHFSGAGRPLILVRGSEITVHKTNKGGLGGVYSNKTQLFDEVVIPITRGDMFYMFTDGYPDQFGFGDRFKFTSPSFRKLLVSLADEPAAEQHQLLDATFNRWKGDAQQSDDVLVAGFRIT